jgi:isopenicillin-N epimerase
MDYSTTTLLIGYLRNVTIAHNEYAALWQLDKSIAYLNHGSYGAVPISVQDVQNTFIDRANSNPNHWFRFELPQLMIEARHIVAYWFGVAPEHFAFVPNASQGVVTAIQALVDDATTRNQRTHLVATSLGYGGVLNGMQHIAARSNASYAIADVVYPHDVTAEIIGSRIRALLPTSNDPCVVVLDHITSETGVLLPVDEIIELIHSTHPQAKFVIDAAHSAGMLQQPLPNHYDVWVGNLHKWLCAPRPAAALICGSPEIRSIMKPLAPSWGFEDGFPTSFEWQGTSDYSAYLSVPAAIAFQEQWAHEQRDTHNREVADGAAALLRQAWGTSEHLGNAVEAPWLRMVQLPVDQALTKPQIESMVERAGLELSTECMCMTVRDKSYVRLSAHMYNEIDQYERLIGITRLLA